MDDHLIPLFFPSSSSGQNEQKQKKKRMRDATVLLDVISRKKQHVQTEPLPPTPPPPPPARPQARKKKQEEAEKEQGEERGEEPILRLHLAPIDEWIELHHLRAWLLLAVEDGDIEELVLVGDSSSSSSSRRHRGFGFAVLRTALAARRVVESLDGSAVRDGGARVRISPANRKPRRQRNNAGGRGDREREGEERTRRFGDLEAALEKRHKQAIAAQVEKGERDRKEYLAQAAEKARGEQEFLAKGGTLPGGFGHGYTHDASATTTSGSGQASAGTTAAPRDRPKLHSGYAHFPME